MLPDLGTSSGIALVVMLVVGLAKWRLEDLRGRRTGALVVAGAIAAAVLHAVILGAPSPIVFEQAVLTGLLGAAEALGVAAMVRLAAKKKVCSGETSLGPLGDV